MKVTIVYSTNYKIVWKSIVWELLPYRSIDIDIDEYDIVCRYRPGRWKICTLALGRPIRRNIAEGIPIGDMARGSIKIDLKFDLKFELKIDLQIEHMNSYFTILYPSHVIQFVLLLVLISKLCIAIVQYCIMNITTLCGNFYYTVS